MRGIGVKSFATAALLVAGNAAYAAPTYQYDVQNPSNNGAYNNDAGEIESIATTYDQGDEQLSWQHTIADKGGQASDGFWLVLSDGPNPKYNRGEYAILYGDSNANRLTAYEYSGQNNGNSWQNPGNFLDSFGLSYSHSNGAGTFDFDIDVSGINGAPLGSDWNGAQFGSEIGIWFHPVLDADFTYNGDRITQFSPSQEGWFDTSNQTTSQVPLPGSAWLMALGLAIFARRLWRR